MNQLNLATKIITLANRMKQAQEKHIKRRLRTSSLSTVLSISLVLLMLGCMGFVYANSQRLTTYIKENIGFTLILEDDIKSVDVLQFQKNLDASDWVKTTQYVSKKEAADILQKDLGEDFISFLGYNPLSTSIDIYMNAEYANPEFMLSKRTELEASPLIKEIVYQADLVEAINKNVKKLSLVLFSFCLLLLIVAVTLINNTIRLSVYSKRFVIRSMKLVGATNKFIRKPFILNGISQGILSGLIGILLLMVVLFGLHKEMPELLEIQDIPSMGIILFGILLFGILISAIVTNLAVGKYLRMKEDELYH
jgi:cell division transport system permease protein